LNAPDIDKQPRRQLVNERRQNGVVCISPCRIVAAGLFELLHAADVRKENVEARLQEFFAEFEIFIRCQRIGQAKELVLRSV
jgi:hypothetical protein